MIALRTALAVSVLLALSGATQAQEAALYRVVKSVPLGAPDRWDYVFYDAGSHRVFVAHGDRVSVVDGGTGDRLGEITGLSGGSHGVAVSPATGRGYTDDGTAGTAVAFDLKTLKSGKVLHAAPDADGIVADPVSGRIFVINGDSGTATVIDPAANEVVATIQGGGKLEAAAADGAGALYINGAGARELLRVDTRSAKITARWPIPTCESPHGIAIDSKRARVFVSCVNAKLLVIDARSGSVVAILPIGKGTDAASYDPVRHRVFSSNGRDGTVTVIQQDDADTYRVAATIPTAVTARTMDLDPTTGRLFLVAADVEPATGPGGRPKTKPGSVRLMMLDPTD